ncbi:MAG: 1-(5-phosphoribosyl)-5-[(5-phosphoribosylamino)methylideneamino]imidazole-4-carboxamide isomerase [Oscillospiraceae bacterium]|jgi:phosphoribosylformimino-5-aminoimidazole carboxamide ribotide isomerase|nr:1-(5-phosphoribosyl)-5-[(5-phosphoribosylamino)methylideneamino]imidazole-4-carboxamide isomerase [Oscillospiraceae bacterium]
MLIFPAIDLYDKKVVRLTHGDYNQMTVYSDNPLSQARSFHAAGAAWLHTVDLEGAKSGTTPNFDVIARLAQESGLPIQVGGGIRTAEVAARYINAGVSRIILGTAAVKDPAFLDDCLQKYGKKTAVGVDIRDGLVSVSGWLESSGLAATDFIARLEQLGVKTVIVTDISKDGAMQGTNLALYRELAERFSLDIVASGGVSTISDVTALAEIGVYGAILGKALYTGAMDLKEAVLAGKGA